MDKTNALTFYEYYPDKNIKDYVYYRSLLLDNPILWGEVNDVLQQSLRLFSDKLKQQSLNNLYKLYISERNKEINFLKELGIELKNENSWDELIKGFNLIYNSSTIFYRNVGLIQKINTENKNGGINRAGMIDIINFFQSKIKDATFNFIQNNYDSFEKMNVEDFARQIIKDAWELLYSAKDMVTYINEEGIKVQEEIQAYEELKNIFQQLDYNDSVFNEIIKEINMKNFESFLQKLKNFGQNLKKINKKNFPNFSVSAKGTAGNLLEIVTTLFINTLKTKDGITMRTGDTLQKADLIQLSGFDLNIDLSEIQQLLTEGRGGRQVNIQRIINVFDKLQKEKGNIVFISDKNYNLTSDFFADNKGFSAQSIITVNNLKNFFDFLNTKGGQEENIEDLIFVMANTGDNNFLNQDINTIERYLATKIGYFLFDDVTITEELQPPQLNAIHVFNLNNVYIPFSVFLQAAFRALNNINPEDYRRYVNVNFTPEPYQYKDQKDGLELLDWEKERKRREEKSEIVIHFFGDFVNFIKNYVKI